MFAIVKDGAITQVANSVQKLFSYTVPPGSTPMAEFMISNNVFEVVDGERKDEQYYFVTQGDIIFADGVATQQYTNTAKDLTELKTYKTYEVKQRANRLLFKTDWTVIRKAERDVAVPDATATYRAAVITECARLEAAIAGAADVDALETVMGAQNWPEES